VGRNEIFRVELLKMRYLYSEAAREAYGELEGNIQASVAVNESIFRFDYPQDTAALRSVFIVQESNAV
jgi:hypothetical protein